MARLFVCCELENEVRLSLSHLTSLLKETRSHVSWTRESNLHVTMKFLGEVDEECLPAIKKTLHAACDDMESFRILVSGIGAFPSVSRPRVIWAGVTEGEKHVSELQHRIESALSSIGFPTDSRRFHSHITLGRVRQQSDTRELSRSLREHADKSFGTMEVTDVLLMQSRLQPAGAEYSALERIQLKR